MDDLGEQTPDPLTPPGSAPARDDVPPPQAPYRPGPLGRVRAAWFGIASLVWTAISFVVGLPFLLTHPPTGGEGQWCARLWAGGMFLLNGLWIRVHGREHLERSQPRMYVANHSSFLDPPCMALVVPGRSRFLLKRELLSMPFVGWYAKMARHFLIDRTDPRQAKALQERALDQIRTRRHVPIIFPEGTRSADGRLAPLKAGAFDLALKAGIDVQPIWIEGAYRRMPRDALYPRRGGLIHIYVGPPIAVEGLAGSTGRRVLAERAEAALRALEAQARRA